MIFSSLASNPEHSSITLPGRLTNMLSEITLYPAVGRYDDDCVSFISRTIDKLMAIGDGI
jgi:hypothetical protein